VEGAQHRAFGAVRRFRVVNAVDQQGESEDVRKQDEFLVGRAVSQSVSNPG